MSRDEQSKKDLIDKSQNYYQFNQNELKNINEFKENYHLEKAIDWYRKESFL